MFACASAILTIILGIRHSFGLFLQPVSAENGWGREVFGLAMAVQNLLWGFTQPFTGMLADRYGAGRVLAGGGALFAIGLAFAANVSSPLMFTLAMGVFVGLGLSSTTFNVVLAGLARAFPPERRSTIAGGASAAGSLGQFVFLPLALGLMGLMGWHSTLLVFTLMAAATIPLAMGVRDPGYGAAGGHAGMSVREAFAEAAGSRAFWLLGFGYFTCGFQIVFIGVHFPSWVTDQGFSASHGMTALAIIGLFNIFGSFTAGWLGQRLSNSNLLAGLYAVRAVIIAGLLLLPTTPAVIYVFSALFGFTWLATVPLTNGVVAKVYGVRHFAMLAGLVFMFHQVGSFFGSWLGGRVFDTTGSYDIVWMIAIGLSVTATLVNLPIDERPLRRTAEV